jgi:hypothetical protein
MAFIMLTNTYIYTYIYMHSSQIALYSYVHVWFRSDPGARNEQLRSHRFIRSTKERDVALQKQGEMYDIDLGAHVTCYEENGQRHLLFWGRISPCYPTCLSQSFSLWVTFGTELSQPV